MSICNSFRCINKALLTTPNGEEKEGCKRIRLPVFDRLRLTTAELNEQTVILFCDGVTSGAVGSGNQPPVYRSQPTV